jgi:MraZ protein
MAQSDSSLILGEYRRVLDDRFRLSIPLELLERWDVGEGSAEADRADGVLVKERPGCLSLWRGGDWKQHLEAGIRVVESKLQAGRLGDRLGQVQTLGRLLSTRHRPVQLAGRGRLVIPEGYREFLAAEAGTEVLVVGAAVCIEIWQPEAWRQCLNDEIPRFVSLLDDLSG